MNGHTEMMLVGLHAVLDDRMGQLDQGDLVELRQWLGDLVRLIQAHIR